MSKKNKNNNAIPDEFASYEQAAEFWSTPDTTDYPDAFDEVELDKDVINALRKQAQKLCVPISRLASK